MLRRYSGFAPDDGIADGETISVGAAGVASGPPGLFTVAVLSIGVAGGVPAAMRASNTIDDAAVRGHGDVADVDAARAVRAGAGARRRVDGARRNADDRERAELGGEVVDDADARRGDAGRLDERDRVTHGVAGVGLAAVQVDDASSSTSRGSGPTTTVTSDAVLFAAFTSKLALVTTPCS